MNGSTYLIIVQLLLSECCDFITHCLFQQKPFDVVSNTKKNNKIFFVLSTVFTIQIVRKKNFDSEKMSTFRSYWANFDKVHKTTSNYQFTRSVHCVPSNVYFVPSKTSNKMIKRREKTKKLRSENKMLTMCAIGHILGAILFLSYN